MKLNERFASINGLNLRFVDEGVGEPLVLIHGLGERIESWKFQLPVFSKYFRTIALDLRGFGKSDKPETVGDIYDFVEDVKGLIDFLNLNSVNLLGFSMGGMIALAFYEKYPEYVKSLILADTISHIPKKTLKQIIQTRLDILNKSGMEGLAEYISDISFHNRGEAYDFFKEIIMQNDLEYYREVMVKLLKTDLRKILTKVKVPTLILVGEYDRTTPPKLVEYMLRRIPKSTLRVIDDSAHMTKMENPKEFNEYVISFLKTVCSMTFELRNI